MDSIGHRELRNNSADVLRRVAAGEMMEVTNHGGIVAYLSATPTPVLPFPVSRPARRKGTSFAKRACTRRSACAVSMRCTSLAHSLSKLRRS
ncbi:MAG TPA: type II toxin-antitoxin system prevent-host-death family antitoxin [Actinomycetales bacterium]|nr:type II toxin-antitoxin system prevent-host-death family antitoxin [Actinomycetales bacterium]